MASECTAVVAALEPAAAAGSLDGSIISSVDAATPIVTAEHEQKNESKILATPPVECLVAVTSAVLEHQPTKDKPAQAKYSMLTLALKYHGSTS